MRRQIAVLLIGMLVPQLVAGQALAPGSRVRVTHPFAGTRTGTVVALTPDTLEMRLAEDSVAVHLPLAEVTRLEVSRGKRRHLSNAPVGLLVGAAVGALAGYAAGEDHCSGAMFCIDRSGMAAFGAIALGGAGGLIGLVKGAIPTESWERVPVERPRVSLVVPGRAGLRVGLRVGF